MLQNSDRCSAASVSSAIAALVVVLVAPLPAEACSCAWSDTKELLADADAVFLGTSVAMVLPASLRIDPEGEMGWRVASATGSTIRTRVTVERVWKGQVPNELLVDGGLPTAGSCNGGGVEPGERHIYFTWAHDDAEYYISECAYPRSDAVLPDFIRFAGPGYAPMAATVSPTAWPSGGMLVLIGALGLFGLGLGTFASRRARGASKKCVVASHGVDG